MRANRWWLLVAVVLVITTFLSACGGKGGETASEAKTDGQSDNNAQNQRGRTENVVEIRFPWWGNVERHERYNALLDMFEKHHPHIRV